MPSIVDHVDLEVSEPTCFFTWGEEVWRQGPVSPLIRRGNTLHFEYFDPDTDAWEDPTVMALEDDGLYHFRRESEHRWAFLAETKSHVYLTGNFINEGGMQGVEMWIWPRETVKVVSGQPRRAPAKKATAASAKLRSLKAKVKQRAGRL